MKTVFDLLTLPRFRMRPELFIGKRDLHTLETWIRGYEAACEDAGERERLNTPNGVPVFLLRDYIALQEGDNSTGGIAYILLRAAGEREQEAWDRFFSHLDRFLALQILEVRRTEVSQRMKRAASAQQRFFRPDPGGGLAALTPDGFQMTEMRKIVLTDGLCWILEITPDGERFWPLSGRFLAPEAEADAGLLALFGTVKWERT